MQNIVALHDNNIVLPTMLPTSVIQERGDRRHANPLFKAAETPKLKLDHAYEVEQDRHPIDTDSDIKADIKPLDMVINQTINNAIRQYR